MPETQNSAERLYQILLKAKEVVPKTHVGMFTWGAVFEIELIDTDFKVLENFSGRHPLHLQQATQMEILHRIFELNKLVSEVEDTIKKVPNTNHDRFLKPFPRVRRVVSPAMLSDDFKGILSELSESDMTILEFCSELLGNYFPEKIADEALLKELIEEIASQFEKIESSDLPEELRKLLLDLLETMRQAIYEYRIRGIERLREALEKIVGIYVVNKATMENQDNEEVNKIKLIINKFFSLYSFAADTVQLIGASEIIKGFLGQ